MKMLVASNLDPCANNMARYMIDNYHFKSVYNNLYKMDDILLCIINEEALYAEYLNYDVEYYIFLSRHKSESKIPTLTSHFTGNFSKAEFGGNSKELAYTYPSLQKSYMQNLSMSKVKDYHIIIEATHHGPTSLSKPSLFIEIGSTLKEWNDMQAISIVCDTIIDTLKNIRKSKKIAIALGSTHYPSKFNDMVINSEFALGHIAPKYALQFIDHNILNMMIERSIEKVDAIIIDKKGLGKEKERIMNITSIYNLEVIKV